MWKLPDRITEPLNHLGIPIVLLPHTVKGMRDFWAGFSFPNEIVIITLNQTDTKFIQELLETADMVCPIKGRITLEDGDLRMKPLQGSIAFYFTDKVSQKRREEVRDALDCIGVTLEPRTT